MDPASRTPELGAICDQHQAMLRGHALHLCRDHATAEDLVQETFLRAIPRFAGLKPETNHAAWLTTILTNLFLDDVKHERVVRKASPELVHLSELACEGAVATISDHQLRTMIDQLEPELREVIELCHFQHMKYREAGRHLGLPAGTVGTRLLRARAHLKELLTARDGEPGTP